MNAQSNQVRLEIPASPEYVLVARLAAVGLASRAGLNYDEVDDLRVAVAELCQLPVGEDGRDGTVTLTYIVSMDAVEVEGRASAPLAGSPDENELSLHLIAALADEHDVDLDGPEPSVRLVKRAHG